MSVQAIKIDNLPQGLSSNELYKQLVDKCPEVFKTPSITGRLNVQVFVTKTGTVAVVKGFSFQFEKLNLFFRNIRISKQEMSRKVNIKADTGEERNERGEFLINRTPVFRRSIMMLSGESHRKMLLLIPNKIRDEINWNVFTGKSNTVYLNTENLNANTLLQTGGINFYSSPKGRKSSIIRFYSILEQLQGIIFLNLNSNLCLNTFQRKPQFTTEDGKHVSKINNQVGIGVASRILPIFELSMDKGYIPIEEFNPKFLNKEYIDKFKVLCWRCKKDFEVKGINLNLNSVAGTCKCSYILDVERDGMNPAYRWPGEKFTRLIVGEDMGNLNRETIPLLISHYPIQMFYSTPQEYAATIIPLLEEEWYYSSSNFKVMHSSFGAGTRVQEIERFENKKLLSWNMLVKKISDVWSHGNPKCVSKITLQWNKKKFNCKGRVFQIIENNLSDPNYVRVFLQAILPSDQEPPSEAEHVDITPKPSKTEYKSTRHNLNQWIDKPLENNRRLLQILLDPHNGAQKNWLLPENWIHPDENYSRHVETKILRIIKGLNEQQKQCLELAQKNGLSFISGPPGTGKSITLASIILILNAREGGHIWVTAPSNFAADELARSIINVSEKTKANLALKVLRVYAKSREEEYLLRKRFFLENEIEEHLYDVLHEEIRKLPDWQLADESMVDLLKKKEDGKDNLLKLSENAALKEFIRKLEKKVLQKYTIFVSTVAPLGDYRIASCATDEDAVTTIIVDEAGQLTQPAILNLFTVSPKRLIFAGDSLQLRPTIQSFAASVAGLDKSLLEVCSWSIGQESSTPIPWTGLKIQHRMHDDICNIVSAVTYQNTLVTAEVVRERQLASNVQYLFTKLDGRRIAVLDHQGLESMVNKSYKNETEAKTVARFADNLVANGVPGTDITILTFYEGQKKAVNEYLKNKIVEVKNVDAFQGKENQIVIVSLVRGNREKKIGFLNNQNRLNVAISRAREFLIIACNTEFFIPLDIQYWKIFMSMLQNKNKVKTIPSIMK